MGEKLQRFTDLMKQVFELDKSDLDFGIYRIMNIRKAEIEGFLTEELPKKVRETLAPFAGETDPAALETDVYSALYAFFNRYYEEGDFISKRRYKEGVYAIPYEGEEVKLYWANQDQYYIKTSENFKEYTFLAGDYTVHFRLAYAATEQDNNKEKSRRTFMLFTEDEENYPGIRTFEYNEETKELFICFRFDIPPEKKKNRIKANCDAIHSWLAASRCPAMDELFRPIPAGKGKDTTTPIEKHLKAYAAKNTFDYFIHKDLRVFLTRELDFYLKSEIMRLDDLDTEHEARVETWLAKVKAIRRVGKIIIDFLAQIEDFQKKLWLKKKFVVETNWCMTLDKVDESFWPELLANKAQIDEWISLYAVEEAEGWTNPPGSDFLRRNQNLLIDTRHFSEGFKERLTASIDRLDEQTNGLMFKSENYQALNLLLRRYRNGVDTVYIDPPYNARSSEILYKNNYKHSSWLSLMRDRIDLSRRLLKERFVYTIAIDETEQEVLGQLLNDLFPGSKKACVTIVHNPRGQQGKNISYTNEFAYMIYPGDADKYLSDVRRAEIDARNLRDSGTESDRTDAAACFYPFYVKEDQIIGIGPVPEDSFHPGGGNVPGRDGSVEIWPVDDSGREKKWRYSVSSVNGIRKKLKVKAGRKNLQIFFHQDMGTMRSTWVDAKYDASEYGTKMLQSIFGTEYVAEFAPNMYPKSLYTEKACISIAQNNNPNAVTVDFFAGSGTTGHAVVALNREDGGARKYVLVEMGEYFDTVTKPRMQKVIYADDWKEGKPQNRSTGVSQIIKYMRLESYEDALSNIELNGDTQQMRQLFGEEYLIRYMLDLESRDSLLNAEAFRNPFDCRMKITEKNEPKERPVDLAETFHYLIGLTVTHQSATSRFSARPASVPACEGAVELVKDSGGLYAFRRIEGILPDGQRALVIWRTVTDHISESNAALDAYFIRSRDDPAVPACDVIFVNGDNNLENLRAANETWKVRMTEIEFRKRMFEEA